MIDLVPLFLIVFAFFQIYALGRQVERIEKQLVSINARFVNTVISINARLEGLMKDVHMTEWECDSGHRSSFPSGVTPICGECVANGRAHTIRNVGNQPSHSG